MPPSASFPAKKAKKKPTREAAFNKALTAEKAARSATLAASGKVAYRSFNDRLATAHIGASKTARNHALAGLEAHGPLAASSSSSTSHRIMDVDDDLDDEATADAVFSETSFGRALTGWRELNLSLPFTSFAQQAAPLAQTLPLLLHHREKVSSLLADLLTSHHPDAWLAYDAAIDLVPRLALDLQEESEPVYPELLGALLHAATLSKHQCNQDERLAARLVENAFDSAAVTLRVVAPLLLRQEDSKRLLATWDLVKPYLGWYSSEIGSGQYLAQATERHVNQDDGDDDHLERDGEQEAQGDAESSADAEDAAGRGVEAGDDASRPRSRPRKVPSYTRRFAAEALAHLARKARETQLDNLASAMIRDASALSSTTFTVGVAAVWAEVCKASDGRLQSGAIAVLERLLALRYLKPDLPATLQNVSLLVLVNLTHQVHSSHLAPVAEMLITRAASTLRSLKACSDQKAADTLTSELAHLLQLVGVFVGVRKGKRVDDSLKPTLFGFLLEFSEWASHYHSSTNVAKRLLSQRSVELLALSLPLGRIQELVGRGIKIIDAFGAAPVLSPHFAALVMALGRSEISWSGFKQFVMPAVMRLTTAALTSPADGGQQASALALLDELNRQGNLGETIASSAATPHVANWCSKVTAAVNDQLSSLVLRVEQVVRSEQLAVDAVVQPLDLAAIRLSPTFARLQARSFTGSLQHLVSAALQIGLNREWRSSPLNGLLIAALAMDALSDILESDVSNKDEGQHLASLLGSEGAVTLVLSHLADHHLAFCAATRLMITARSKRIECASRSPPSLIHLKDVVAKHAASSDARMRRAIADLLTASPSTPITDLLSMISAIEALPLTIECIRDRNVRTRALVRDFIRLGAPAASDAEQHALAVDLIARYLVGIFKLNLSPLWPEAREALVEFSTKYGEQVWAVAFRELQDNCHGPQTPTDWTAPTQLSQKDAGRSEPSVWFDDPQDKEFDDPQLRARLFAIAAALNAALQDGTHERQRMMDDLGEIQSVEGRLDVQNYHSQILKLFVRLPRLVEKHNAPFVEHFLALVQDTAAITDDEDEEAFQANTATSKTAVTPRLGATSKERRARLCSYLELFSQLTNPKALSRAEDLHRYFMSLCAIGDPSIQRPALKCVLTWKDPAHVPYAENLLALLETSKFREELSSFNLAASGDTIQPAHRSGLLPVLIRILFGIMVSRRNRSSSGAGQSARKTAIMAAFARLAAEDLGTLVDLMLAPFKNQRVVDLPADEQFRFSSTASSASIRRQNGFIALLADVIKHVSQAMRPYWPQLISVTLNLAHHASLAAEKAEGSTKALRSLRQAGLRRIAELFNQPGKDLFNWQPFLPALFEGFIDPRLPTLPADSAQGSSALLDLFYVWSGRLEFVHLLHSQYNDQLLPSVFACLAEQTVKPPVITRILDIVDRLLVISTLEVQEGGEAEVDRVLRPNTSAFLNSIRPLMQRHGLAGSSSPKSTDDSVRRLTHILASLARYVESPEDASQLLKMLGPMLRKSNHAVPERTKTDLLRIFRDLLALTPDFKDPASEIFTAHYHTFSAAFATMRSAESRQTLVAAFGQFAKIDTNLARIARWIEELNAFSTRRVEEPDFDRRLEAFDEITSSKQDIALREWVPLLQNMLHFIQDQDELAIRSNAGQLLRVYLEAVARVSASDADGWRHTYRTIVQPGLRRCIRSKHELVRREVLGVLMSAIEYLGDSFDSLGDMKCLLADGDEEASFFTNIYHTQLHRRARALKRLGDQAEAGRIRGKTIVELLSPLLMHFLIPGNAVSDHNLITDTIVCFGRLAAQLQWGSYNALLWRFLRLANETEGSQKIFVRAAMAVLDSFHFELDAQVCGDDGAEVIEEGEQDAENELKVQGTMHSDAVQQSGKILDAVTSRLLPALMGYLDEKDEADDAVRLPVAIGVCRVALRLPEPSKSNHIGKLLTTLANVQKSKSQVTRDLGRDSLCKVMTALGPEHLPTAMRELRRALVRGTQLAVLAFTAHGLLVHLMSLPADAPAHLSLLEHGVEDLVHVATEDIFGLTAEDRVTVENRTKLKEVKHSKSMDTFERLAKVVAPLQFGVLLEPVRDVLAETEAQRSLIAAEDALRRIASGLNANPHFGAETFFTLCHSLIAGNAAFLQPQKSAMNKGGAKLKGGYRFITHMKRRDVELGLAAQDHRARNAHRFVAFGLDLLVTALRRERFKDAASMLAVRLDPLVNLAGHTLYAPQSSIVVLSMKAISGLVKHDLPSLEQAAPVFAKQILAIVQREGTAQSTMGQAAIKCLTSVLRGCQDAHLPEQQLADLVKVVIPELEEPLAQSAIFALLRGILSRKIVLLEMYEAMDKIAEILVTNQSATVRDSCRAAMIHFMLEYPLGKSRLRKQMQFMAKNLSYTYESGRLSLLSLLSSVLAKFDMVVIREHADLLFVALVTVLANDDSSSCREQAARLIGVLCTLVDEEHRGRMIHLTHSWATQREQSQLMRVAMQVYGIFLGAVPESASEWLPRALSSLDGTLQACVSDLVGAELDTTFDDLGDPKQLDWQLAYQALQFAEQLRSGQQALDILESRSTSSIWRSTVGLLLFPHAWVRLAASRSLGSLFASTPAAQPTEDEPLSLDFMIEIARKLALQLQADAEEVNDELSLQAVKNLLYIGRCFALMPAHDRGSSIERTEEASAHDEGDDENESTPEEQDNAAANPLAWLYTKLSFTARGARLNAGNAEPQINRAASVLRWFAAMATQLESSRIEPFLSHMIGPIFRILDDESLKADRFDELKSLAMEVQELLQAQLGATRYAAVHSRIKQAILEKRRERKTARLMQGISNPEAATARRAKENAKKHESRKRKNAKFADTKVRNKPSKRSRAS
ncbi:DRIM (Down-regulated in metastasis)-like proteins [Ceraceosorus bombacis]|uniref:DRIM (Down-regulated in metastasis)-like proteins n=1 Tax=Ceraceosorus bombacis TaxID=401625 RepID=A0A0P1BM15_9BASI|nr:DRIM (Down-regulated in metastasis)-like proteins [Ceraceosorus bombacis]